MEAAQTTKPTKELITKEAYFKQLERSEHKLEFVDGVIRMMAGGTRNHATIVDNTVFALRSHQGSCSTKSGETAVSVSSLNRYYFPDASVVCEEEQYESETGIALLTNPCLVVEVLSRSTGKMDCTEKFNAYRQIPSFREYLLIDSETLSVQTFYREANDLWQIRSYWEPGQQVYIRTLDLTLPIEQLYAGVTFPEPDPAAV